MLLEVIKTLPRPHHLNLNLVWRRHINQSFTVCKKKSHSRTRVDGRILRNIWLSFKLPSSIGHLFAPTFTYCWWKKSFTSWYREYPIISKVLYIPGGAGFLPSTVWRSFTIQRFRMTFGSTSLVDRDLFGDADPVILLKGCWWPPTKGSSRLTYWITWQPEFYSKLTENKNVLRNAILIISYYT